MNPITTLTRLSSAVVLALVLASGAQAQGTTGVAGFNDYTIGGMFPGASSCSWLPPMIAFSVVPHTISTTPNTPVAFLFTTSPNCLCRPCVFPLPNQSSCPLPPNTSCPTTNQSLDLDLGCGLIAVAGVSDAAGIATLLVTMPGPGWGYGTQGIAVTPCATPPFPFLLTQAYSVRTI